MISKQWKAFERVVAKYFGSTRTPLSGGNGKQTRSDSLHEHLFISCKYNARNAMHSLFQEEAEKAKKEHKIPVICTKVKGEHGFLITLNAKDFTNCIQSLQEYAKEYSTSSRILEGLQGLQFTQN